MALSLAALASLAGLAGATGTANGTGSGTGAGAGAGAGASATSQDGSGGVLWLCRPGRRPDPCAASRRATSVSGTGAVTHQRGAPAGRRPVDCFYVYPTVSTQDRPNATITVDPQEVGIAEAQASRFSQDCRVYAPVYPQGTIEGLGSATRSHEQEVAYAGLLRAWHDYLDRYNHGRRFVLIGHSQGAVILTNLVQHEIDGNRALRRRMVSAILLGGNVLVRAGARTGGDFAHVPTCDRASETGCVVAYSTYMGNPPADGLFGRVGQGAPSLASAPSGVPLEVACVSPSALLGRGDALDAYFPTAGSTAEHDLSWWPQFEEPTQWVRYPGLYTAQCRHADGAHWLDVAVHQGVVTRPVVSAFPSATWGLHVNDVNLELGDLVALVHREIAASRR